MQFRDLAAQYKALKSNIDKSIQDVINSSSFILGAPVMELEERLAQYVGRKYCVTCGNGTDALQLSMMSYGIGRGDAVFTSDFTFFASSGSASILGATPVFVDIDPKTFNISPEALDIAIQKVINEKKLTPKAIIAVDLFGQPANFTQIVPIAKKYDLLVIEDGAQGFGGNIAGKKACSFGDISTTSFFPAKPLGCYGDGGAVFTDDEEICFKLKSLRAQGKSPIDKYDNCEIGMNSRLDTVQAAILLPKLKAFIDYELDAVNHVAEWYTARLKNYVRTPTVSNDFYSSWAQYTIMLNNKIIRDNLKKELANKDIPSMIYYPRGLHQQNAYKWMNLSDDLFPNTTNATNSVLSLPMHPYLEEHTVNDICTAILSILKA